MIVRVEVADLWNAPLLEPVRTHPMVGIPLGMFSAQFGLDIDDIESVTIGFAGLSEMVDKNRAAARPADFIGFASGDAIVVIRTKKTIPVAKVTAGAAKQEHAGTTWFRVAHGAGTPTGVFFPQRRIAVLGPEKSIRAAIDRGDTAAERPDLEFADLDQHLVAIVVPKDPALLSQAAEEQAGADAEDALPPDLAKKLRGVSLGVTLTEGADLQIRVDCADADAAERMQAQLTKALDKGRAGFGTVQAAAGAEFQEGLSLVQRMLQDAKVSHANTTVELAASLPREAKDVLARAMDGTNPLAIGGGDDAESGFGFGFEPAGTVPVPPEPVSLEGFNESWQVDLNVENEPAGGVLASLADGLSMQLQTGPEVADAVQKPVSLSVEDASRFAAIEMVCGAVGVHPVYTDAGVLKLQPGPRSNPAAVAGPFLVEVENFDVFPRYASGHLKLRVVTAGLPRGLMHAFANNERDVFGIEAVTGPDGEDLVNTDEGIGTYFSTPESTDVFVRSESVNLKNLLRKVDRLSSIRGRVQLSLPTATQKTDLLDLRSGGTAGSGEVRITVTNAMLGAESSTLDFSYQGAATSDLVFVPLDASGQPLPVSSSFGGGSDTEGQSNITVKGRPVSVAVTLVTAREELEYEFHLENVPVPQAEERPEALQPLEFAGHPEPVSVESLGLNRSENSPKVQLRATNHSNKDVRKLEFRLDYLDAQGQKLDDWPGTYSGEASLGDQAPPIAVRSAQRAEFELQAHFAPEETKSVKARLVRVVCADGTVWTAPDAQ
jgi:hypothetical protein